MPNTNLTIWEPKRCEKLYINMLENEIALSDVKKQKKTICRDEL